MVHLFFQLFMEMRFVTENEKTSLLALLNVRKWKLSELTQLHPDDFWVSNGSDGRTVKFEWEYSKYEISKYSDVFEFLSFLRSRHGEKQLFPYQPKTMGNRIKDAAGCSIREFYKTVGSHDS